jgi:hypothetical protein
LGKNSDGKYLMKNLLYIFLVFSLSGCAAFSPSTFDVSKPGSPGMRWMYDGPPPREDGKQYDQLYVQGWKDGCETGVSANTNAFYKYFNTFKQDWKKAQEEIYYKGWKDAFNYCGRYIYQYNRRIGF